MHCADHQHAAAQQHLPPGFLRLSVGCEHIEDLWDDLAGDLAAA